MKLALALICIGGCAWYAWLIFSEPPLAQERAASRWPSVQSDVRPRTPQDDALERLAAKLDGMSETLEEIKTAVASDRAAGTELDRMQTAVTRAAAIDRA